MKKDFIKKTGEVVEALPSTTFNVKLEGGQVIRAYLSGKMRIHNISVILGDKVQVAISPYDLTKGRIIRRL